ncbi:MAG TPA: class I SAM-dependent methyltransferase [Noviherbaspirillum sp.]|nr:class I SAM-dependent methyltransferase [Noviherbaspirillum sp.]
MVTAQDKSSSIDGRRRILKLGIAGICSALLPAAPLAQTGIVRQLDVPYEPTPHHVVDGMLALANVGPHDLLYDLGCGDGRIVITAAQTRGARGVGIDLDPRRIADAIANARKAGVEDKVKFMVGDLYASEFSDATVVTLFLWPHVNRKLRPILWRQLRPGTRVVSHVWDMGEEWPPDRTEVIDGRKIYLWTITDAQKKLAGK